MSPGMRREIIALPEHMGMCGYLLELVFISVALQIHVDGTTKGSRGPHDLVGDQDSLDPGARKPPPLPVFGTSPQSPPPRSACT